VTRLPQPVLRVAMRAVAWAVGERGWSLPWLGIEASPFGSAMVSSVGMLGLPTGFSPLVWLYRVPLLVLVGEISDKPLAIDGKVEIRPVLPVTFTVDHRYVDGVHLGKALSAFREYSSDPFAFEPAQTDAARPAVVPRTNGRHT
jgi:pyruvate dehydrogenase E2 component (dihydrolipoamide acetyltransferase)